MKRYASFSIVTVVLLFTIIFSVTSISATQIPGVSLPPTEYLIALSVVSPNPKGIPAGLEPEQAVEHAYNLTYQQAQPIIVALERLRQEGHVTGFERRPDLHGIEIKGVTPEAMKQVSLLQGVAAIIDLREDRAPSCAAVAAEALREQVLGLSHANPIHIETLQADANFQATNPSIAVFVFPGNTWGYVNGQTIPSIAVSMRIHRGGQVIATQSTTSGSSGHYYFYPSWQSCPTSGYNWTLRSGDVVEVTAQGNTVSTVVVAVSAWVDPQTNVVAGKTSAGRAVRVTVTTPDEDPCLWRGYEQNVTTNSHGNFTANFTNQVNFNRRAWAWIDVSDANGNSTSSNFAAYRIGAELDGDRFFGYLKPDVDFTATLRRGGSVVSTYTGKSTLDNSYSGWFTQTIQSGDVIAVGGGGVTVQYAATNLDMTLDHMNNRITGTTTAGRQVEARFYKNTSSELVSTSCSWNSHCNSATASGAGSFTILTTLDWTRGDYADVYVHDAQGNYQYSGYWYVPVIVGEVGSGSVSGYWHQPHFDLTAVLKDSGGTVKAPETSIWASGGGRFFTWFDSTLAPTDRIEVGNGVVTETMIVQNLTARLSGSTGRLTGNAPNSRLVAHLQDFRHDSDYLGSYCQETNVTGGAYNLMFGGAQVGAHDSATVWSTGADGHQTRRFVPAFSVNAYKESNHIWGNSETPNTSVVITLKSGATTKATANLTSSSSGYYSAFLSDNGTPVSIVQGDTVQVQTGDGSNTTLQIPELTLNTDAAGNRIHGRAPANQPVRTEMRRWLNYGAYMVSQNTSANGAGAYSATYTGLFWSRDCSVVQVTGRCIQPTISYYNSADHQIVLEGNTPPAASADAYESNNTAGTATLYNGIQTHTFHAEDDVDWIKFTVPVGDVNNGVSYRIETFNLGWGMDTYMHLYDTDGTTELAFDDDGGTGVASLIVWTPPATGTYYVKVRPYSSYSTAYCDAYYDLMILPVRAQVYLPLVARNY
jgi:hypothetical protein